MSQKELVVPDHISELQFLQQQGNASFKEKDFPEALKLYTEALQLPLSSGDSSMSTLSSDTVKEVHLESVKAQVYANRSATLIEVGKFDEALKDAEQCIALSPGYVKGYYRQARALETLGRCNDAIDVLHNILASKYCANARDSGLYSSKPTKKQTNEYNSMVRFCKRLSDSLTYRNIETYSLLDDTDTANFGKPLKVYIDLEGVDKLPGHRITCEFKRKQLDLRIRGLQGSNWRLYIPELWGELKDGASKYKCKTDRIILVLHREGDAMWDKLGYA